MATNGAFTLAGFESPEEIRKRIGKTNIAEEQALKQY